VQDEIAALTEKQSENRAAQLRLARMASRGRLSEDVIEAQERELEQESSEIEGRLTLLRVQLQQAQENTLPIREIEDACQMLSEGIEELTFQEKRWIIRALVGVIYADKDGWKLEGRLPCLSEAQSSYEAKHSGEESPGGEMRFQESPSSACSASPMSRTA
jgi:hypothetical protein